MLKLTVNNKTVQNKTKQKQCDNYLKGLKRSKYNIVTGAIKLVYSYYVCLWVCEGEWVCV